MGPALTDKLFTAALTLIFGYQMMTRKETLSSSPEMLIFMAVIGFTNFVMYPYIWYFPKHFHSLFPKNPTTVFRDLVAVHKAVVGLVGLYFYFDLEVLKSNLLLSDNVDDLKLLFLLISLGLITFGAYLNVKVYEGIGVDGVYYGFKLGKTIPWVTAFPFDTFRHPQYYGAFSAMAGLLYLVLGSDHSDFWILVVYQAWAYAITSLMEESSDNDADSDSGNSSCSDKKYQDKSK